MTLDQLRYFYTAAIWQHMGQAAVKEHISQPSLSIAIHKLEDELGVRLFRNHGRGIELTEEGEELLPYARNILQLSEDAKKHMEECAQRIHTQIRMAYTASVAFGYIPRLFEAFLKNSGRQYQIFSDEMPSDDIAEELKKGRIDYGICSKVRPDREIVQTPILYQPLVLIVPQGHRWGKHLPKRPEEILEEPFVAYRKDYPMYRQVREIFGREGITLQGAYYAYSEDAIAQLVRQGLGVSIVAKTESVEWYEVEVLKPEWLTEGRYLYLTYHKDHYLGRAVREMMEFILAQ